MTNKLMRFASQVVAAAMVVSSFVSLAPAPVMAADATAKKDVMSRQASATASNHVFTYTAVASTSPAQTVSLTFPAGFVLTSLVIGDVVVKDGASTRVLGASCTGAEDASYALAGQAITFTVCAAKTFLTSGNTIEIDLNNNHVTNPTTAGASYSIVLGGTGGQSGIFMVYVVDSDQVSVSATVEASLSFDIDTALSNTETSAPYRVALGTLSSAAVKTSDHSAVNSIFLDFGSNALGGMDITVRSLNAALQSASVSADKINSASATLVAGTEGYGVCVTSVTSTSGSTPTAVAPFNTGVNCTTSAHQVGVLTTADQQIVDAASALVGGEAEILVKTAISSITKAHPDYGDTLTFLAAATF